MRNEECIQSDMKLSKQVIQTKTKKKLRQNSTKLILSTKYFFIGIWLN